MTAPETILRTSADQRWLQAGSGQPMLLIHGIGGTTATWRPVFDALSRDRHVVAWTFPGYDGAPALPDSAPAAEAYAARLLDLMDQLSLASADLVGHSLGALVAATAAAAAPERVKSLSLVCPVTGMGGLEEAERIRMHDARAAEIREGGMANFARNRTGSIVGARVSADDLSEIVATMAAIPADAYLQAWAMMCRSDILRPLAIYRGPARVLGGACDPVASPASVGRIAETLGIQARILEAVGHFPTHEATDDLLTLLRPLR